MKPCAVLVLCCVPIAVAQQSTDGGAVESLRKRAEKGEVEAQYRLGLRYARGEGVPQSWTEALGWYRKAADRGYSHAQFDLAVMYYKGSGVEKNSTEALRLARPAAEKGYAAAQFMVGQMYAEGEGVARSDAEALPWFQKAAEQGIADAQYQLGRIYAANTVVPRERGEAFADAYFWLGLAASRATPPNDLYEKMRDFLATKITPDQRAEAQQRMLKWKPKREAISN